jgi:hypothetical protein
MTKILIAKKLWSCFFKYSMVFPDQMLVPLLNSLIDEIFTKMKSTENSGVEDQTLLLNPMDMRTLMNDPTAVPLDPDLQEKISSSYGVKKESLRLFWILWKLVFWINMEDIDEANPDNTLDRIQILTTLSVWLLE